MKKGRWDSAKKTYSVSPADYHLQEEVGHGSSATVYRALYLPYNEIVAVKCMDLDRCSSNLDDIRREAQTMSLIDHPSVVKGYCSFVVESFLWVVMPFLAEGSCLHLMKSAYPDGFEECAIGSILKETLKALEYLHKHGHIHRDVKAGNILLDSSGAVKLGDFGVTACMFDKGDRQRSRNTFVGTPCWMAPEVLQPGGGYDFKADIWSLGITALELAHGHAPFSKYPPMKVLLMTLQNAPPGLDYDRDKRFSKSFKEMVAMCLVKDQNKRPSAHKLLKHYFFKNAKPAELSMKSLLANLPPLWDRVKELQLKDAEQLAMKKMPSSEQEALSQSEYQRGVSAWNFDMEDMKIQASLIQDDDDFFDTREVDSNFRHFINNKEPSILRPSTGKTFAAVETAHRYEGENQILAGKPRNDAQRAPNFSGPLLLPRRASANSLSAPLLSSGYADSMEDKSRANVVQIKGRFSVTSENVDLVKDVPLCNIPQRPCQGYPLRKSASVGHSIVNSQQAHVNQLKSESIKSSLPASILMPHLQNLFQQSSFQQDLLSNLLNGLQQNELVSTFQTGMPSQTSEPNTDLWADSAVSERERILLVKIAELQSRIISLTEELASARLKHIPLQQQLKAIHSEGELREEAIRMP